jgi:hypothetical protein
VLQAVEGYFERYGRAVSSDLATADRAEAELITCILCQVVAQDP